MKETKDMNENIEKQHNFLQDFEKRHSFDAFSNSTKTLVENTILNSFESASKIDQDGNITYTNAYSHYLGNAVNTLYPSIKINYITGMMVVYQKTYELGTIVFIKSVN